jgi:hypothetical protein
VIVPRALVQQSQFESAVSEVEKTFRPQVVRVRYDLGDDSTGEPAVFFRILLSDDAASRRDQLWDVTNRVSTEIVQRIEPLEQWGVLPYFSFRSEAEQTQMNDPAWA